jgi:hypothetical protein
MKVSPIWINSPQNLQVTALAFPLVALVIRRLASRSVNMPHISLLHIWLGSYVILTVTVSAFSQFDSFFAE